MLQASQANFADLSVTPNFATGIQKLEGTVLGLSSKQNSRAKIDIHGSVDEFAPVSITGEVNVLGAALYTDLAMSFRNIELSTFNPYSGKFAGYNISKGKLTTELHYKVDGRKLDAQHHIIVEQLEFGDKTASKDAVSLPVKLAVALLKDRDGVIDLNLPVTGSLDDPTIQAGADHLEGFREYLGEGGHGAVCALGIIVRRRTRSAVCRFSTRRRRTGSSRASKKPQSIVKALDARPQLKIEIPIAVVGDLDRPGLVEAKYRAQLQEALVATPARKKSSAATAFEQLDGAAQLDLLTRLYVTNFGGDPKFPDSIEAIKTKPEKTAAKNDFLVHELHQHIAVTESELTALGQQRAMSVQQALLTGTQIAPERVFLVANDKAKNQDGRVRLELSLR